jgi:hypothetical protein
MNCMRGLPSNKARERRLALACSTALILGAHSAAGQHAQRHAEREPHSMPMAFADCVVQRARGPVEAAGISIGPLRHGQSESSRWRQGCATTGRTAFCAWRRRRRRFCGRRRGRQRWAAADSERGALMCVRQRGIDLDWPRATLPRPGHPCCTASWAPGCAAPPLRDRWPHALHSLKLHSTH